MIYVDANATTPVLPEAYREMCEFLKENFGNPSAVGHILGRRAREAIDNSRAEIAALIGSRPEEIVFTGSGTESCFLGVVGAVLAKKGAILHTGGEHSAVLEAMKFLEKEFSLDRISSSLKKNGLIDEDKILGELNREGSLVSLMLANNETGVIFPVEKVFYVAKKNGWLTHCDATQAVGKIPVSVKDLNCDLLSFSGHKFGAPKGVGVLYIKRGTPFKSVIKGGGQEHGFRGGTESVPMIAAIGEAAKIACKRLDAKHDPKRIRDLFEQELKRDLTGFSISGVDAARLPNTSHLQISGIFGWELVEKLGKRGIICSAGSACKTGTLEPSHVLLSMGYSTAEALGALRISFLPEASEEEAREVVRVISEETELLRKVRKNELLKLVSKVKSS